MLRNRAFDEGIIPENCTYDANSRQITSPTGWTSFFDCCELEKIAAWEVRNGASMQLTDKNKLNKNRKRAFLVRFIGGLLLNEGFMGVSVESGKAYRFYMFAKAETPVTISKMLTSANGDVYVRQDL